MRIGELARQVGVSTDTVRFYERSGWLPRASCRDNDYREYGEPDVEHLRLLIDLRRLDVPLEDAARIAGWCHAGHCADATAELPRLIEERRADIADRIAGLQALDSRLADLGRHLARPQRRLAVMDTAAPCCDAAEAVVGSVGRISSSSRAAARHRATTISAAGSSMTSTPRSASCDDAGSCSRSFRATSSRTGQDRPKRTVSVVQGHGGNLLNVRSGTPPWDRIDRS